MRIQGNIAPAVVNVETYAPIRGYAEIRLRENINEITVQDEISGNAVMMFEYDEYVLHVKNRDNLQADIEANLDEWLTSAKSMEIKGNESLIVEYEKALTEIETALGVNS